MHFRTHFRRRLPQLAVLALLLAAIPAAQATADPVTHEAVFEFTGQPQVFQVPDGVTEVTIDAYGAPSGGAGGQVKALLPVIPGEPLFVYVGGQPGLNGEGGWNGGGNGGANSISCSGLTCWNLFPSHISGGGGASDVRQRGTLTMDDTRTVDHRVVVAGGGGGGSGGAGGGSAGQDGSLGSYCSYMQPVRYGAYGGSGGTSGSGFASGGSQMSCSSTSSSGSPGGYGTYFRGGDGGSGQYGGYGGGGGGGGYGAGGGGGGSSEYGGGGGGGAGYVAPTAQLLEWATGVHTGNGRVVITWEGPVSEPLPIPDLPDDSPPIGEPCSDPATHVETVSGTNGGYGYKVAIHNTPTDVEVCTELTDPSGGKFVDEDVVVPKDTDPTDYLPPFNPPEVDSDAAPGDGAGTPCTIERAENGTSSARGYVRTSDSGAPDTVVCVGFRGPGAQRHVRVTVD